MNKQSGFTVLELMVVIVLLATIGIVFWVQKNNIEVARRDDARKSSINALHYSLEEVYYPNHKNTYPKVLNQKTMPSVDASVFKDPSGVKIGEADSDFRYEGKNCSQDSCKSYTLRASLENEADFVKTSLHK